MLTFNVDQVAFIFGCDRTNPWMEGYLWLDNLKAWLTVYSLVFIYGMLLANYRCGIGAGDSTLVASLDKDMGTSRWVTSQYYVTKRIV